MYFYGSGGGVDEGALGEKRERSTVRWLVIVLGLQSFRNCCSQTLSGMLTGNAVRQFLSKCWFRGPVLFSKFSLRTCAVIS